ncbi:hypothetical protein H6F93_06715 [Leptolyngbya sp. FACHB-671]|uniref:calcium-binding protein n=1 Tax=Leptolyngbya sp. FACHB-671 TaxID=2692812 RepID=UPI001689035D|nr:calcium-binding protein [Leptolyngbya sp. FACHB-671]MBD2067220.1 hypothetical protein [Leptolyngbya sp. FACHB-671]
MAIITGTQFNDNGSQKNKLNGTNFDDSIFGFAGNDWLNGFGGNDLLNGGLGADKMIGGQGNDTYIVDISTDQVFEAANEGIDTVKSSVSFSLSSGGKTNVENLTLLGNAANGLGNALNNYILGNGNNNRLLGGRGDDSLSGAGGVDTLFGGTGNDRLFGGIGADAMFGSNGSDTYYVDNAADIVNELDTDNGYDKVISTVSFGLSSGVEQLFLDSAGNVNGLGNDLNNQIYSGVGHNKLSGSGGNDYLSAGDGNDRLLGGTGNDTLVGTWLDNAGKGETDRLTGGTGVDYFALGAAKSGEFPYMVRFYDDGQRNTSGQTDYALITDFKAAEDKIQLVGSKSEYLLANVSLNNISGTGIYIKSNSQFVTNELIGVVQNVAANTLSLDSNSFSFVFG